MEPGDALFFHCNVLHRSDQSKSDRRRWAFLIAYNRASNDPVIKHSHPNYTKLNMVSELAINSLIIHNYFANRLMTQQF